MINTQVEKKNKSNLIINNISSLESSRQELCSIRHLIKRRSLMQYKIREIEERVVTARTSSTAFVKGGAGTSLEELINKLLDLKDLYNKEEIEINNKIMTVEKNINIVAANNPLLANILSMYFVDGKKLEQVSLDVGYCYSQTKMYLKRGILNYSTIKQHINKVQPQIANT